MVFDELTNFLPFVHQQCSGSQSSYCPTSSVCQIVILRRWCLRSHCGLLVALTHRPTTTGLHCCVLLRWWWVGDSSRVFPCSFPSTLVDVEPTTVGGIVFSYPAGREVVGRWWACLGRRMGSRWAVPGSFACVLVDPERAIVACI